MSFRSSSRRTLETSIENDSLHDNNSNDILTNQNKKSRKNQTNINEEVTEKKLYNNDSLDYCITDQRHCCIKVTPGELAKYEIYDSLEKKRAISCICRLFIFKGSKGEPITKTMINTALTETFKDPMTLEYNGSSKKHINALLADAQRQLYDTFGYSVCNTNAVSSSNQVDAEGNQNEFDVSSLVFKDKDKEEKYFLINSVMLEHNNIIQKHNQRALSPQSNHQHAVQTTSRAPRNLSSVGSSNGNQTEDMIGRAAEIPPSTLIYDKLASLETDQDAAYRGKIEQRIPDIKPGEYVIPELGMSIFQLLARMKKEGYIVATKDNDKSSGVYSVGPRFFLELGPKQLIKAYYYTVMYEDPSDSGNRAKVEINEAFRELEKELAIRHDMKK